MSNRPKSQPATRYPSSRHAAPKPKSSLTPIIIGVVVVAVVIIAVVVALVVSGGDDEADSRPVYQPVTVTGDALPEFAQEIQQGEAEDGAIGVAVPVVSGLSYEGEPVVIDPASDGPALVVLLAHWCPHCNAEIPVLNEWRDAGDVPAGLDVIAVSTAATEGGANYPPAVWLDDKDWQWPALADDAEGSAFTAFGGTSFPTLLFVGSDGEVRWRISGEIPLETIQTMVDEAMADEP